MCLRFHQNIHWHLQYRHQEAGISLQDGQKCSTRYGFWSTLQETITKRKIIDSKKCQTFSDPSFGYLLKPLQGGFFLINSEASRFYAIDLAGPNLFEFPRQPWSYKFAIATGGLDVEVVGIDQLKRLSAMIGTAESLVKLLMLQKCGRDHHLTDVKPWK